MRISEWSSDVCSSDLTMRGQGMKQSRWKIVDQSWCRLIAIRENTIWSGSVESISSTKPELVDYRMACEGGDVCLTSRGSSKPHEDVARCPVFRERNSGRMPIRAIDEYPRFLIEIVITLQDRKSVVAGKRGAKR